MIAGLIITGTIAGECCKIKYVYTKNFRSSYEGIERSHSARWSSSDNGILKVDGLSIIKWMRADGLVWKGIPRRFANVGATKVLTAEISALLRTDDGVSSRTSSGVRSKNKNRSPCPIKSISR